MTIADHNGQSRFVTPKLTRTEDLDDLQRCRPRGGERPDFRGDPRFPSTALPAAEQYAAIYAGAVPRGNLAERVPRTQADADRTMLRQQAAQPRAAAHDTAATLVLTAEVQRLHDLVDTQAEAMKRMQNQLDSMTGNSFAAGGES